MRGWGITGTANLFPPSGSSSGCVCLTENCRGTAKTLLRVVCMYVMMFEQGHCKLTSTCVSLPSFSGDCVSKSLRCCCSVSRRAEQKLLKALGPRLGKSRSNRQLRFCNVCSAYSRDQIRQYNNVFVQLLHYVYIGMSLSSIHWNKQINSLCTGGQLCFIGIKQQCMTPSQRWHNNMI